MGLNVLDVLFLAAIVGLEVWRRWLCRIPEVPRWLRYVAVVAAIGTSMRLIAWRYGAWRVESETPHSVADAQGVIDRITPYVIAGNLLAVGGLVGAVPLLLAATWRYRWRPRRQIPPTFGPYR